MSKATDVLSYLLVYQRWETASVGQNPMGWHTYEEAVSGVQCKDQEPSSLGDLIQFLDFLKIPTSCKSNNDHLSWSFHK